MGIGGQRRWAQHRILEELQRIDDERISGDGKGRRDRVGRKYQSVLSTQLFT